jgi:hypothetical protein
LHSPSNPTHRYVLYSAHNCASLRALRDWQLWIYPLLCDVPMVGPPLKQAVAVAAAAAAAANGPSSPSSLSTSPIGSSSSPLALATASITAPMFVIEDPQAETQKNIYGYCLNVLTLMHYEAYMVRLGHSIVNHVSHMLIMCMYCMGIYRVWIIHCFTV